jgi:CopG family transcriptional regulator, nickel-responsive regulator
MKRFGVSLEEDLLADLDGFVRENQLPNRSQAIRHLIRDIKTKREWRKNQVVSGCVVLVYDHHKRDLMNKAVEIQHKYQGIVLSSQHVHLDHDNCLETIILKGTAGDLRDLADRLIGIKGMKHGELVMSTLG